MNNLIARFHDDVRRFWLLVLQSLNGLAITVGGSLVIAQAAYPEAAKQLLAVLPPKYQAIALLAFGALVHWATRQAKKAGQ